jgi:polysaccharide biosynthesis protein PslH
MHGEHLRTLGLAQAMSAFAEVDILGLTTDGRSGVAANAAPYRRAEMVPLTAWQQRRGIARAAVRGLSLRNARWFHPGFRDLIEDRIVNGNYDIVLVESLTTWMAMPAGHHTIPLVHSSQNVDTELMARIFERSKWPRWLTGLEISRIRREETDVTRRADGVIAVSERDLAALKAFDTPGSQRPFRIIPNCVAAPAEPLPPRSPDGSILFVASLGWRVNAQAARWLVHKVGPALRARGVTNPIWCVGSGADAALQAEIRAAGAHVAADVESVWPYYEDAAVVVAPLLVGGGTRTKVVEGWAACRPVVATSIGAEGLGVIDGSDVLIADNAEAFAEAIAKAAQPGPLADGLVAQGVERALPYQWPCQSEALREYLLEVIEAKHQSNASAAVAPFGAPSR